ncbi:MAG: hypothetical protein E7596_04015 [Ruminococcaceae bacterium]|nr:hypothetical protein [Oscillospiraceae bacterium]
MKRVQSACIMQDLVFKQKEDRGFPFEKELELNRAELEQYIKGLEANKTKYIILNKKELENGHIAIRIKKQYNENVSVGDFFD